MRWMITGLDDTGRSRILSDGARHLADVKETSIERILVTQQSPPPPVPGGSALHRDLGVGEGLLHWRIVTWGPNFELPMHHTDTIDLDCVIEGSVDLLLDDGVHTLGPGDCVVVPGVDHGWRTGATSCIIALALFGTSPR